MKEKVRKFSKLAYWLILGMILMYIVGMQFYAQEITDFIGYRFYAVMTDSIGTYEFQRIQWYLLKQLMKMNLLPLEK